MFVHKTVCMYACRDLDVYLHPVGEWLDFRALPVNETSR